MKVLKGNLHIDHGKNDFVMFSCCNDAYADYLHCNILSLQNTIGDKIRYRIAIQGVELSKKNHKILSSLPNVDIYKDTYKGDSKRRYCIASRFSFLYNYIIEKYDTESFLILDADLIIEKDITCLINRFNNSNSDLCTLKKKKSNKLRALGMQLVKNNDLIKTLFKLYDEFYNPNDHLTDWDIYEIIMERNEINEIIFDDFSKFNFTDYIPFLHGKAMRKSNWYKDKVNEIIKR